MKLWCFRGLCLKDSVRVNGCWYIFVVVFCFPVRVSILLAPYLVGDALCWAVMPTMQVEMLGRYFFDIAVNPIFDYLIWNISFLASIIRADLTGCKRVLCMHHNVKSKDGTWKHVAIAVMSIWVTRPLVSLRYRALKPRLSGQTKKVAHQFSLYLTYKSLMPSSKLHDS